MNEMAHWDSLGDRAKENAIETARHLLLGVRRWVDQAKLGGSEVRSGKLCNVYEENNRHLLSRIDNSVVRHLGDLLRAKVPSPAKSLYCAVWDQAMKIPQEEITDEAENAITLVMLRVQSTAQLVEDYKAYPLRIELIREMNSRKLT